MPRKPKPKTAAFPDELGALSPYADPVINGVFDDVKHIGLAAESLLRAIVEQEGVKFGKILSVKSQSAKQPNASRRGSRVDIRVEGEGNTQVILEIQLYLEPNLFLRNWLATAQTVSTSIPTGTNPSEFSSLIPRVIVINLYNHSIRDDNEEIVQPAHFMFEKPPVRKAFEHFSVYTIQLPKFRKTKIDWNNSLHNWLYALDSANTKKLTIQEVIDMTPQLKEFAQRDLGFDQYAKRYATVTSSPEVRQDYALWLNDTLRDYGIYEGGVVTGKIEGEHNKAVEIAKNALSEGLTPEVIAKIADLPLADVLALSGKPKRKR
jgi:predicted transposase/invertase (TIGR01784 family)